MAELCERAREELAAQGVELAGYNVIEMADDVAELADALGYEQIHLLGHSFGTLLGQVILARHPGLVARFVSVGTAGPGDVQKLPAELSESLARLSALVAGDERVGAGMPDLANDVRTILDDLSDDPLPVPTRKHGTVELGRFGLQLILVADLGDTSDLPSYPRLVRSLLNRDPSVVAWYLEKRLDQFSSLPLMMLAVRGSCGATEARWKTIRDQAETSPFGLARCLFSPESDAALGVRDVGDAVRADVSSEVPTLFVSGTLDAHTPPHQAERVRAGFSQSGHVVVEFGGHEDLLPDPAIQERIVAFFAGAPPRDERIPGTRPTFAR